ncbi:unnamed protein product, partial [Adineta ricciae]
MMSSSAGPLSLRDRHIATLKQMLNLNASSLSALKTTGEDLAWKVVIYDELGQDIIAPLLTVKELRDLGVTLHVSLKSERDPVDEIAAVYFIMPTKDNINRIAK